MLSIQELVKKTGVSSRMLRYYDEKGLLHPAYRSDSGVRYYDESAIGAVSLIGTFLSLNYRIEEIQKVLSEETFSPEKANQIIQKQQDELLLQREKIDDWLQTLDLLRNSDWDEMRSWKDVENKIHQIMYEKRMRELHRSHAVIDPTHNTWIRQGSDMNEWMKFMFAPVVFPEGCMQMAEVNATYGDFWLFNQERLPKGKLDLFYDSSIRESTEGLTNESLQVTWQEMSALTTVADGTYDLVFNDHLHFYGEDVENGLREMRRILKGSGVLYVTCEDPTHDKLFSHWLNYIRPSRSYRIEWYKQHYSSEVIIPLVHQVFGNVTDFPRINKVRITDEHVILDDLKRISKLDSSDRAGQLRFDHTAKEIHTLMRKHKYIERESFYHVIKAEKTS